jgi:hypothetical protein
MDNSELIKQNNFREISFSKLSLSVQHAKLLKRICGLNLTSTNKISETIGGILDLNIDEFAKKPSVGKSYIESLISLKKELLSGDTENLVDCEQEKSPFDISDTDSKFCVIPSSLSELHLNYLSLSKNNLKLIKKLEVFYGAMSIEDIFNCDPVELQNEHGFTLLKSIHLKELQDLIKNELVAIAENNKLTIEKSKLLISSKIEFYNMCKIDEMLIEDIEAYLWSLD